MIAKYFATSLAIENVVSGAACHQQLLPISTTSISLVDWNPVHHIAGLARRLRAGVHG